MFGAQVFISFILAHSLFAEPTVDQTTEMLNSIQNAQKGVKELTGTQGEVCWDCIFKEKKMCDFNDVCRELKSRGYKTKLYTGKNGSYLPNYRLLAANQFLNGCRIQMARTNAAKPDSVETVRKRTKAAQKQLYAAVRSSHQEKEFLAMQEALLDMDDIKKGTDNSFEKTLAAAESAAKVKLSPSVREKWLATASSFKSQQAPQLPISVIEDPLVDINLLNFEMEGPDQLKKAHKRFADLTAHVESLYEGVKSSVIENLKRKKTGSNAAQIDNLVERVRTVQFMPTTDQKFCPSENAYYYPGTHSFTVCPQVMMLPDPILKAVIAHELGHSIDPCSSTSELKRVAGTWPLSIPTMGPSNLKFPIKVKIQDEKNMYGLYTSRAAPPEGAVTVASPIKPADYPFNKTVDCLQSKEGAGAAGGNVDLAIQDVQKQIESIRQSGGVGSEGERQLLNLLNYVKSDEGREQVRRCSVMNGGQSQLGEAFADQIAAPIIANDLSDDKAQATRSFFESVSFFSAMACQFEVIPKDSPLAKALKSCNANVDVFNLNAPTEGVHPFISSRINRIWMANPTVQERLGCKSNGVKSCDSI